MRNLKLITTCIVILFAGNILAQDVLINSGSSWNYYDNGNEPTGNWESIGYNDASWNSGNAQLGYGDGDETTVTSNTALTTYFRHSFNVVDASLYSDIDLNLTYDDGAIIYLNGTEIWRVNLPAGAVNYSTFTLNQPPDNSTIATNIANSLVNGNNVLAVEIHQRSATSSDISFDFDATANLAGSSTNYVAYGTSWNYYDLGNEPAGTWEDLAYNDASWSTGNAELGYGDGDETTVVNFGPDPNNKYITTYFRHDFNATGFSPSDLIEINIKRDDGAVVYLNGVEVLRDGMPSGPISYNTLANVTQGNAAETTPVSVLVAANNLNDGANVIAVEIHQAAANSSDITMDLEVNNIGIQNVAINRGPYLQKGTPTSIVVRWRTTVPALSQVNYGTTLGSLNQTVSDPTLKTEHELEITGLTANTQYFYEITDGSNLLVTSAADVYFKTAPIAGTVQPITAWILGDCGTADNNQRNVRDAYYSYIGSNHTDMMLFLGDNAYNSGTDAEYQDAIFENMYEDKLKNSVSWSTLGNHDGISANSSSQSGPYYDIFTFPTAGEAGGIASGTEAYYSFDYGNIHFIVLESNETDRSSSGPMYLWAESDIQNTTSEWIVALWHHPPYTKGSHDSDTEGQLIDMRSTFLPMLENNGVDLVLSGHSHSYERSYLLNGHYGLSGTFNSSTHTVGATGNGDGKVDGNGAYSKEVTGPNAGDGAVYITAGSSGKVTGTLTQHNAMYEFLYQRGSVVMEVDGNNMDVKFIHETGNITDYFTIEKPNADCGNGNFVGDPCDDGNAATVNDMYDATCTCVGEICNPIGTPCNDGDPQTTNDVEDGFCNCAGTPPTTVTTCIAINAGNDDVEEHSTNGTIYNTSSDIELVFDDYQTAGNQTIGLRFNTVDVPQGATIISAYVQFTVDETNTGTTNLTIKGHDVDNAPAFSTAAFSVSGLATTSASAAWTPPAWNTVGAAGTDQQTSDISGVIQEIVDRTGYAENNSIALIITGTGERTAESYNGSAGSAAVLCIEYDTGCPDADGDTVCDDVDQCPGQDDALIGTACDDGDACTTGEIYDNSCNCSGGTFQDADSDGVCDANDQCPGTDDALIGTACDDSNACTTGDIYDSSCNCAGTFADADSDGVCDANDQCPGTDDALIGTTCDDGDACTTGDIYDSSCNCAGTFTDTDSDGVCDANDQCPGTDDALIGTACDDGDACTTGDIYDSSCNCAGTFTDADNDGVCDANDQCPGTDDALIGTACDDGDACTTGETYDNSCNCSGGTFQDADSDGVCDANDQCPGLDDAIIGTSCDDGNSCTINDIYDSNCSCSGTPDTDSDGDGICDAQDQCPGQDDALIGTACDDGDACTTGETYNNSCNCSGGTFQDADSDGVCDANDQCPGTDDALIGTACDDGNVCTTGDIYDNSCNCSGTFQDADSDGVCDANDQCPGTDDALIGTSCDDSNVCTTGDVYNNSCNCGGTFQDADGDGVCDANDQCPGFDDNIDLNNNNIPDGCEGCNYETIDFNNFEAGWGIWNDGGSDCRKSSGDANYALGTYCVRIRDNTSTSTMSTDNINLLAYDEVTIDFSYYPRSMDNSNEDFWLQVSTNGGINYTTVEEWNRDDEFVNNQRYYDQVVIPGPFTNNTRFRFRCDASGNSDWIYIDEVEISGCNNGSGNRLNDIESSQEPIETNQVQDIILEDWNFILSPVPAKDFLNIKVIDSKAALNTIKIFDLNGRLVQEVNNISEYNYLMDISEIKSGIYLISIQSNNNQSIKTKKFIVTN